jgi:hypothetical protein
MPYIGEAGGKGDGKVARRLAIIRHATSDGGRTWQRSAPIALTFRTGFGLGVKLDFVDPQAG